MRIFFLVIILCSLNGVVTAGENEAAKQAQQEILQTEEAFCKLAADSGLSVAFGKYAAEDAAICRDPKIIRGRSAIQAFYGKMDTSIHIKWKPSFVSVSSSCDLGYTYGEYDCSRAKDGKIITEHGTFHTVWKKQNNGRWRYVVD